VKHNALVGAHLAVALRANHNLASA
jgi:hypothetical protein